MDILESAVTALAARNPAAAELLRQRFQEKMTVKWVATEQRYFPETVYRQQKAAEIQLCEILIEQEVEKHTQQLRTLEFEMPAPSYRELFGVADMQGKILRQLTDQDGPSVIVLSGIGGVGKTAIAHATTLEAIRNFQFTHMIWLRAGVYAMGDDVLASSTTLDTLFAQLLSLLWPLQADLPSQEARLARIREAIETRPHLIIIDNLEAEHSTVALLDQLTNIGRPSKFLLTTRSQPPVQSSVFTCPVDELSLQDSTALLTTHAKEIRGAGMSTEVADHAADIYGITGGNPLALKLVVVVTC